MRLKGMINMIGKIVKSLNSVNSFSRKIIIISCAISLFLCIIGIGLVGYNNIFVKQVELYNIGSTMILSAGSLFAHMVIGALIIDFLGNVVNNHDD